MINIFKLLNVHSKESSKKKKITKDKSANHMRDPSKRGSIS